MKDFIAFSNEDERHYWFQQDGAKPHTADGSLDFLSELFENGVISKGLWPLRSPDLTPCNFFLRGYLKNRVYGNKPCTLDELKSEIETQNQCNDAAMYERVFNNIVR